MNQSSVTVGVSQHDEAAREYYHNTRSSNKHPVISPSLSSTILNHIATVSSSTSMNNSEIMEAHFDSHANMVVLGKCCWILSTSKERTAVSGFVDDVGTLPSVPIVDAVIAYDFPHTYKTVLLVLRNALYIESMEHHLLPPFILREAGLIINETPKIQCEEAELEDHTILLPESNILIHLKLKGIFSYFNTRMPTDLEINNCNPDDVEIITPEGPTWNPYSTHWRDNEESYINYKGGLIQPMERENWLLPDPSEGFDIESVQAIISELKLTPHTALHIATAELINKGLEERDIQLGEEI